MPTVEEVAEAILRCGPLAMRAIKEAAVCGLDTTFAGGLEIKQQLWHRLSSSEDAREGPLAFVEKRKPQYKGR